MKIKEGYILREVAGYSVVVPIGDAAQSFNGMININDSGALLWRELEKGATEESLVQSLVSEYGIDVSEAKADVADFISKMREADLINE